MTNEIVLLKSLITGQTVNPEFQPQNNIQAYLAYLNGLDIALPEPRTAEEVLLCNLCANGIGGSGASFTIEDASYLFYRSARYEVKDKLISLIKNMKTAKAMFYECMKLTEAPVLDWSSCTDADNAFYGCANMAGEIDFAGAKLQKINSMFYNCVNLEGILNFALKSTGTFGASGSFPKGTSSTSAALKRFTFAPDNTFTALSGLDFSYCSFEREGAVEMFNSLKTVSNPGGNYNQITLKGNPCVTGKAVFRSGSYVTVNSRAEAEALFDGVPLDAEVTMQINNDSPRAYSSLEDAFANLRRAEFPLMLSWDSITYAVDTLTDADRAIATDKGWTLVEA